MCACGQTDPAQAYYIAVGEGTVTSRRLNAEQLQDLSDELAALSKLQLDARLIEVYVRMTQQEIEAFDLRAERISKIHVILSEHDHSEHDAK